MNRKELTKSIILFSLVASSIFLSYLITAYKPDYEILSTVVNKKVEGDLDKQKRNSLNILAPHIVVGHKSYSAEQTGTPAIIKAADTPVVKDRQIIKEMLESISTKEIDYSRIRNQSISEVLSQSKDYYTLEYQEAIDSGSAKLLYFANTSNQNSNIVFDRVLISDFSKNSLYLYKSGSDSYMQVFFKEDIYPIVESIFKQNSKEVSKYIVGSKEIYIDKDLSTYRIDEYDVKSIDITEVANNIFDEKSGIKINNIGENFKEVTDGYAILRENDDSITYINPSNSNENDPLKNNEVQALATNELIKGYLPDMPYSISEIQKNEIKFRENYNSSNVYESDYPAQISVLVTKTGVHKQIIPKIERNQLISSKELPIFYMENIDAIMNYLYSNLNISEISAIELAYQKKYDSEEGKITYSPTWYIKYQDKNYTYEEIKDKFKKE